MMTKMKPTESGIMEKAPQLIRQLDDKEGVTRMKVRSELEEMGRAATPYLTEALINGSERTRWEAAKALIQIKDPASADALAEALMDESFEIQWLAAEALIELGHDAVKPLLLKLLDRYDSPYLRQGAHHVLTYLKRKNLVSEPVRNIIGSLNLLLPMQPVPLNVRKALQELEECEKSLETKEAEDSDTEEEIPR